MATIVLSVALAPLGPVGMGIGAAMGGMLDQKFIFPAMFPKEGQKAPRLGDFQMQTASEGTGIHYCLGRTSRVAGQVIWMGDFIEFANTSKSRDDGCGGGGGGGGAITVYQYYVDLAVAVCEGPINGIRKIWADGQIIYDDDTSKIVTSSQISVTPGAFVSKHIINPLTGTGWFYHNVLKSTSLGPDLTQYIPNYSVTISGFTNPSNNGTFKVVETWKDQVTGDTFMKVNLGALGGVTEAAGNPITLDQTITKIINGKAVDIEIYNGDYSQTVDPLMEATEGSGNVPAYRGISYVVIEKLYLNPYGSRTPYLHFLVEEDPAKNVKDGIADILERSGLTSNDYNTDRIFI